MDHDKNKDETLSFEEFKELYKNEIMTEQELIAKYTVYSLIIITWVTCK